MEKTYEDRINAFFEGYSELKRNKNVIKSIDKDFFFEIMDDMKMYVENYRYTERQIADLLRHNCEVMDRYNDLLVNTKGRVKNDK